MRPAPIAAALAVALLAAPAGAQSGLLSQLGGKSGGLGALGSGVPGIGGAGVACAGLGNVAGLLGYCLKNQLLGSAGTATGPASAGGVLGKLTAKPGVNTSQGFLAGQQGVLSASGTNLPIGSLGDSVKQQLCSAVLGRAKGLLGR